VQSLAWRREDKAWRYAAPPGAITNSSEVLYLRLNLSAGARSRDPLAGDDCRNAQSGRLRAATGTVLAPLRGLSLRLSISRR
jgi:hypothetical protein